MTLSCPSSSQWPVSLPSLIPRGNHHVTPLCPPALPFASVILQNAISTLGTLVKSESWPALCRCWCSWMWLEKTLNCAEWCHLPFFLRVPWLLSATWCLVFPFQETFPFQLPSHFFALLCFKIPLLTFPRSLSPNLPSLFPLNSTSVRLVPLTFYHDRSYQSYW